MEYREHEFNELDYCIHCSASRSGIIINGWKCNPIATLATSEKRVEIQWDYAPLVDFLRRIPMISGEITTSSHLDDNWYVIFKIDLSHEYAWHTVQIIGSILNNMHNCSKFMPYSPAVDLNGGPYECLSWMIESASTKFSPEMCSICLHHCCPVRKSWKLTEELYSPSKSSMLG